MTQTIEELRQQTRTLEERTMGVIRTGGCYAPFIYSGTLMGMDLASTVAMQELLDLGIKGVLPEGQVGRIMYAIRDAIAASKERVVGTEDQALPGS